MVTTASQLINDQQSIINLYQVLNDADNTLSPEARREIEQEIARKNDEVRRRAEDSRADSFESSGSPSTKSDSTKSSPNAPSADDMVQKAINSLPTPPDTNDIVNNIMNAQPDPYLKAWQNYFQISHNFWEWGAIKAQYDIESLAMNNAAVTSKDGLNRMAA